MRTYIPKNKKNLPSSYFLKIHYLDGEVDEFEVASFFFDPTKKADMLCLVTSEDLWNWIPLSSVRRFEWDKNWSKIVAEREKEAREKENTKKS